MDFYRTEPNAPTSWRMAVLIGPHSHTCGFALGTALLELAGQGRTEAGLDELAGPYAMGLLRRPGPAPQASTGAPAGAADFLAVAVRESGQSLALGRPTDELRQAAVRSLPALALQRFHDLPGGGALVHRFFEVTGIPSERVIHLAPELLAVAAGEQAPGLRAELDARWSIVENSFDPGIGRSLNEEGLAVDREKLVLTDASGRRPVAGLVEALVGFQHGRCLLCGDALTPDDSTAVDQVFPHAPAASSGTGPEQRRGPERHGPDQRGSDGRGPQRRGPDLDGLWNLAPAHTACREAKGDRTATVAELQRLARRNETIMQSPQPLRRTLQRHLDRAGIKGEHEDRWRTFLLQALRH